MKKALCAAFLVVSVTLGGCASGPTADQIATTMPTLKKGEGRIYFYRDSAFGMAVQPDIRLNGEVVGESKPNGFFYVSRPAGEYTVATKTEVENTVSFRLDKGETKYVKTTVGLGLLVGRVTPTVENPAEAQAAIRSLSYTGR